MTAGHAPSISLDGFAGSLDELLRLARAQRIDLARLSLPDLLDQLMVALDEAGPLSDKADWVVTAAWLVQLRSRLLLPADDPEIGDAAADAERLREQLVALQAAQALAIWLDRRPVLGRDTFCRGSPEFAGVSATESHAVDVVEFLWSAMALFDDDLDASANTERYQPLARPELYSVAEARQRILERLAMSGEGLGLEALLPPDSVPTIIDVDCAIISPLRRRSAWTSTFSACLEMAKQGEVELLQSACTESFLVSACRGQSK